MSEEDRRTLPEILETSKWRHGLMPEQAAAILSSMGNRDLAMLEQDLTTRNLLYALKSVVPPKLPWEVDPSTPAPGGYNERTRPLYLRAAGYVDDPDHQEEIIAMIESAAEGLLFARHAAQHSGMDALVGAIDALARKLDRELSGPNSQITSGLIEPTKRTPGTGRD